MTEMRIVKKDGKIRPYGSEEAVSWLLEHYKKTGDRRHKYFASILIKTDPFCCRLDGFSSWFRKLKKLYMNCYLDLLEKYYDRKRNV